MDVPARRPTSADLAALVAAAVTLLTVAAPQPAAAADFASFKAQGAQALLAEGDRLANHYDTQHWRMKMTIKPPSGDAKELIFRVWQKDQTKRLVRFDEPGEVKGLSMLSSSKSVIYVYSPDTDNARRIATSARRQTLLGSNITYEDMGAVDLSDDFDATFGKDDEAFQWLVLTRKADSETGWDKLRVAVSKKTLMAEIIEYLDADKVARTQTRSSFEVMEGVPTYRRLEIKTHDTGLVTILEVLEQTIGLELEDKLFKKRNLVRGR